MNQPSQHLTMKEVSFTAFARACKEFYYDIDDFQVEKNILELCSTAVIHRIDTYNVQWQTRLELNKPIE